MRPLIHNREDNQLNRVKRFTSFSLAEDQWFARYKQLSTVEPQHVLLESGRGGRYSMMGLKPFATITGKADVLSIKKQGITKTEKGPLLESFKKVFSPYYQSSIPELPPFQGGAIGYISYDVVREIEHLKSEAADDLGLPDLYFMLFDDVFVYDHEKNKMWIIVHGEKANEHELDLLLKDYAALWTRDTEPVPKDKRQKQTPLKEWQDSLSEQEFYEAVEKIKAYIAAGDVFQVNLSVRQTRELKAEPLHIYETLRSFNPSPYMSYLHTEDFQIVSASPELLVRKIGKQLNARPIAGTRSRGKSVEEDTRLATSLINNEKERAEHVMLVDLERNDLGRVSAYGTVKVNELMVIERYSHVMHIVSNVQGTLAETDTLYDVIRAKFPGGTITGAPKVRTMEIIEELEPVRRGIYTGSIGWIGFDDNMELNITIRTMLCIDGYAHVQAGAGIVIDSEPEYEYKESLKKARALWQALEMSEK